MRGALLLLALATSAHAQEPASGSEPTEEGPSAEPLATTPERPTDAERDEAIKPIEQALATDPSEAIRLAETAVSDSGRPQLHADAWALMGDALQTLGHPHAAVDAWTHSLAADPRAMAPRLGTVLDVAEEIGLTRPLEPALADADAKDPRVHIYAARYALRQGDFDTALSSLSHVTKSSKHFPAAKLVEGVVRSQQRDHQGALAALATAQARGTDPSDTWRWTVDVNLARTYFALGNQPKALVHYNKIDRNAPGWLHVHFETAWAHFRMGDMAGTLAAIHSLRSPFFADGYWAEAELLEAYALVYMCKFPSARERVFAFEEKWKPIRGQLDSLGKLSPEEAWREFERAEAGEPLAKLPVQVIYRYTWDVRTKKTLSTVAALRAEQAALTDAGQTSAAQRMGERVDQLIQADGERILDTAKSMRAELTEMLQDIEITKLDLLDLEKRLYQQAAVTGDLGMGDPLGNIREIRKKGDHHVWPFQGEYWADEVGYYRVTARPDCPADLQIGGR